MHMRLQPCNTDDDFAKVSSFFLKHKYDLHPSFSTVRMIELLYTYMTQGHMHYGTLEDQQVVLAGAYYHGTPENDFKDKEVVLIDVVILDRNYRGSRMFVQSLIYILKWVREKHPEVNEIRLAALSDNAYLCRLYSKFAALSYKREGEDGEESIFCENINKIEGILQRFDRV